MENENKKIIVESEMIESAFDFWLNDHEHIRSPFPAYIQGKLKNEAIDKFTDWTTRVSEKKASKDVNDVIVTEKFEEILFETGAEMVATEDEKLTILYPFMPRIGDVIKDKDKGEESTVLDRTHLKRGDNSFLKVKLKTIDSGENWETEFELPE